MHHKDDVISNKPWNIIRILSPPPIFNIFVIFLFTDRDAFLAIWQAYHDEHRLEETFEMSGLAWLDEEAERIRNDRYELGRRRYERSESGQHRLSAPANMEVCYYFRNLFSNDKW